MTQLLTDPAEAVQALGTLEGRSDPYPIYEALRALGPVLNLGPVALILGYQECSKALREPAFVSTDAAKRDRLRPGWRDQAAWRSICTTMLFSNDPVHERLRGFASGAFSPGQAAAMRPMVQRLADAAVARLEQLGAGGEPVDAVTEFACRLPVDVMGEVLGIPEPDRPHVQPFMRPITEALDPFGDPALLASANSAVEGLAAYFADLIARRRAEPQQDLISALAKARDASGELTEDELIATFMVMVVAGTAAPFDMLANLVALIARYPEHLERMRADQGFTMAFMEEASRFDPAVQLLNRVANEDIEFCGVPIAKDTAILLLTAAANRDPRRYENPGQFDPFRENIQPLTFGLGAHYCLGAPLGRLVGAAALTALSQRFKSVTITGPTPYRNQLVQRGYTHLPVTFS
jgi:cytochrome P450